MSDVNISDTVRETIDVAGLNPRSFAALVGCHFTTIYNLLSDKTIVPLRIVQERIYYVVEFLQYEVKNGSLPNMEICSNKEKIDSLKLHFEAYAINNPSNAVIS